MLSQTWTSFNGLCEITHGNPAPRIHIEDSTQDGIQVIRDWQDGLQKVWITHEGLEGGVIHRGTLPWVPATGQVDQDDAE